MKELALAFVVILAGPLATAFAQEPEAATDMAPADDIVVTASPRNASRWHSSISVSQVTRDMISGFTPRSEAEVLRTIPGLNLQDTAGAGGNANIGVRGIPVSTGGSEYVALQEDGLPVTLFGDIQFGNNDYWVRFDDSVSRVEAVRGGSTATLASQAPGAVINYISKTGEQPGGAIGIETGLNYNEQKLGFQYGERLGAMWRFHLGGFVRAGHGPTRIGYNAVRGYQLKGNITRELAGGRGYVRVHFKRLDDRAPTNTAMPALARLSGSRITGYSTFPDLDARRYSGVGIYNRTFDILERNGAIRTVAMEGIHPHVTSLGGELHYELTPRLTIDDKFRWTSMRGTFSHQWTVPERTANFVGAPIRNFNLNSADTRTIGSLVYAAGPQAGQVYTAPFANNGAQAYTRMRDVGSLANDLAVGARFDMGGGTANLRAGWFHMRQAIDMDWRINNAFTSLDTTRNSVPLNAFEGPNGTGVLLTANGVSGFNTQWGGCCGGRSYDTTYTNDAAYLNAGAIFDALDIDASIRFDRLRATGISYAPTNDADGNGIADTIPVVDRLSGASVMLPTLNTAATPADVVDYSRHYTSWSVGALYAVSDDSSLFARISRGGRFNADRLLFAGSYNADGSLSAAGRAKSINFVAQQEIGIRQRGRMGGGRYTVEATFYRAQVKENNYDFTRQSATNTTYHSYGLEVYGTMRIGGFGLDGSIVYTHARDTATGRTPATMPRFTYRIDPRYDFGPFSVGASVNGQTASWTRSLVYRMPASTYVNGFVKLRPSEALELGLNVNNLFDRLGYRGSGDVVAVDAAHTEGLIDNSAVYGRTISASARLLF